MSVLTSLYNIPLPRTKSGLPIRLDCRFNTGEKALQNLETLIRTFKIEKYHFHTLKERAAIEKRNETEPKEK
jgi:hypothetical protein